MRWTLVLSSLLAACGGAEGTRSREVGGSGHMDRHVWTGDVSEEAFMRLHQLSAAEVPPARGESVALSDGSRAYLTLPDGEAPHPAVLVIHEWWGLNDHIRHWADRLAADGYAALAVDLYGGRIAGNPEQAIELMRHVDEHAGLVTIRAATEFLDSDPRVSAPRRAVIGWCFGGGWSLETALHIDGYAAVVMYYGHPVTDAARLRELDGPLLGIFANQDVAIPPSMVDELEAGLAEANVEHELLRFDAVHAFANPSNERYDHDAAARAWEAVRALLARTLRGEAPAPSGAGGGT